jgi:hypothetical protein
LLRRLALVAWVVVMASLLAACRRENPTVGLDTAPTAPALCGDAWATAEAFYEASDAGDSESAVALLTDDVSLISWATGANGYHMSPEFSVGKQQVAIRLAEPGLRRLALDPSRPNFTIENRQQTGGVLRFQLLPDRLRDNGRPFNHYSVELVFNGCLIEIIKLVERVTWL